MAGKGFVRDPLVEPAYPLPRGGVRGEGRNKEVQQLPIIGVDTQA